MSGVAMSAALEQFLDEQRERIDEELHRIAVALGNGGAVAQAMHYALAGDGKRLRPALCVANITLHPTLSCRCSVTAHAIATPS